ncbi:hypothetical protein IID19_04850, partial [Patescibacteria group bacterium]|nr:hypothetical protein [Patescibacteria group bacterium]
VLENSDGAIAVGAEIKLIDGGGGFTIVFDNAGVLISGAELNLLDGGITLGELTDSGTLTAGTVDINGGALDGTTIGSAVASTGAFTTLASTGVTTIGDGTATVAINSSGWDIDATGIATNFGAITADGLFTTTGGVTLSGVIAIGDGAATVAINSSDWGITTTGVATGIASIGFDSGSVIQHITVELSNADLGTIRATPIVLVGAPGANKYIEFVSASLIHDYGGTNVWEESADNLVIEYGTSNVDVSGAIETTGFITATADQIINSIAIEFTAPAADMVNQTLELFNTGDGEFAGNAGNDNTMTVKVSYIVHDDGL